MDSRDRRAAILASTLFNGVDFVEIANTAQTVLRVHFLNAVAIGPLRIRRIEFQAHKLLALCVAAFAKARGIDERAFEPVRRALGEHAWNVRRRNDDQREIDRLGDRGKIGMDGVTPQFAAAGIDEIDFRRKAAMREIVVNRFRPAIAALVGGADDGDGFGPQQGINRSEQSALPLADRLCIGVMASQRYGICHCERSETISFREVRARLADARRARGLTAAAHLQECVGRAPNGPKEAAARRRG